MRVDYRFRIGEAAGSVALEREGEDFRATVDGREHRVRLLGSGPGRLDLLLDGVPCRVHLVREGETTILFQDGRCFRLEKVDPESRLRVLHHHAEQGLEAPMPGLVRSVGVAEGEAVVRGQTLVVLEAMKMEIRVAAPGPSRVIKIRCREGEQVDRGQVLVELESVE